MYSMTSWHGALDAARDADANLMCFSAKSYRSLLGFEYQANICYDLAGVKNVDGLVINGSIMTFYASLAEVQAFCIGHHPLPITSIAVGPEGIPTVSVDNYQGVHEAMLHLIRVHHYRRIAFIPGPPENREAQIRYQAYVDALAEHGIPFDPALVSKPGDFQAHGGKLAIQQLLDERKLQPKGDIEAVVAVGDDMAFGVLDELTARGIIVPYEIAVVGFDDRVEDTFTMPPLTSVHQPIYEATYQATQLLLAKIRGEEIPQKVILPTRLVVRQSCGCLLTAARRATPVQMSDQKESLETIIRSHRDRIIAEMEQAVDTPDPTWIAQFLDGFMTAFSGKGSGQFLHSFDLILRQVQKHGGNVMFWQEILSVLNQWIQPYLHDIPSLSRFEALVQQARVMIGEMAQRVQGNQRLKTEMLLQTLRKIEAALITTFDVQGLMDVLTDALPQLHIPGCYLSLYEQPDNPLGWSRLFLAYNEQGRLPIEVGGKRFPSLSLVPEGILPQDRAYQFVVIPLYFQEEQIGFVLFEVGPREGFIYEALQTPISSALQGALLLHARTQAEEELRKAKEVAEVAQRASEAANQAKSIFLANMSHELRTPLNAILGFAQIMARNSDFPPEERESLSIIQRNGDHLLTLINQVLDLSKIEAGRIMLNEKAFDLYHLLHDLKDMFALKADNKGLQLLFEWDEHIPQYVRTDEVKLRQVLINLLNNAMKFTGAGDVAVRIENCQEAALDHQSSIFQPVSGQVSILQFSISDTGPGIAPEDMVKVFEAFGQTATGRQSQEGTGLGLPISRKFVQLMGGDIQVKSEVGQGTVFTFDIQVQEADAADITLTIPTRRVIALEPGQPRYRMLIVDDNQDNRQLLFKLLSNISSPLSGFDLREAENGQEAIDIWETWEPHLIWIDIRMPVLDGYEATKRIRALGTRNSELSSQSPAPSPQPPVIIAVTASSFEEERAGVLSAGCDDFLRKPFTDAEVFEMLRKHLGMRFVYEEETPSSIIHHPPSIEKALAALPAEWLETLERGARRADFILLSSVIAQIREQDARLADALAQLAEDFEYDEILALIQQNAT